MKAMAAQDHYAILEVEPGASTEAIRAAWQRLRRLLGPDSLATYSLVEPAEQERLLLQIDEAHAVLTDPEARRRYDEAHGFPPAPEPAPQQPAAGLGFGEALARIESAQKRGAARADEEVFVLDDADLLEVVEVHEAAPAASIVDADAIGAEAIEEAPAARALVPVAADPVEPRQEEASIAKAPAIAAPRTLAPTAEAPVEARGPAPAATPPVQQAPAMDLPGVDEDTIFTGSLLRRIRLARGLELDTLAARTRIGAAHFANVEEERWEELPERVYLRGYLESLARELRLDPVRVCATYLARAPAGRKR